MAFNAFKKVSFFLIVGLAGCATPSPRLQEATSEGIITYVRSVRDNTSSPIELTMRKLIEQNPQDHGDFKLWSTWWCPAHKNVRSAENVNNLIASYCRAHNGSPDIQGGCRARNGIDTLFFAKATSAPNNCSGYPTANVVIIEPRAGKEDSAPYEQALAAQGYSSSRSQIATNANQVLDEWKERVRFKEEFPKLTSRGTKICINKARFRYFGYVDDYNSDSGRIRILVQGATNGLVPGDWKPGAIWDNPSNWHVCD